MNIDTKTILYIALGVVALFGAYWFFFTGDGNDAPLTASFEENPAQAQFKLLVSQLTPITFNTAIFDDPAFLSLVDLATPLSPEPVGRTDPFATLSSSPEPAPPASGT